MTVTREEVEKLKRNWVNDPVWDIEDTTGFEDYRDELRAFRMSKEQEWEHRGQTQKKLMNKPTYWANKAKHYLNAAEMLEGVWGADEMLKAAIAYALIGILQSDADDYENVEMDEYRTFLENWAR